MTGRVFEIREFTLHDGPGVRTTVFLKGCPLRCAWCHNPEGQSFEIETLQHPTAPLGQRTSSSVDYQPPTTSHQPPATSICGVDWTPEDLAKEVLRDADIMRQSGGGVTFSGGEPLAQPEFLLAVIPLLKRAGVSVALETSGAVSAETYRQVVSQVDFVYQDLKHHDPAVFNRWCGGDLAQVLENARWLKTSGVAHRLRVPVIPGVNDSAADRAALKALAGEGEQIEFLPYNPAAGAKYPMLGRAFLMSQFT